MNQTIEELEAALKAAKAEAAAEVNAKRDAVKPVYEYTISPTTRPTHERIYDEAVVSYRVEAICLNMAECMAVGHPESHLRKGGMTYIFNDATGRIICAIGGGTLHIEDFDQSEASQRCIAEVSKFLVDHPHGGSITDIVERFKKEIGR